jgi:FAD synthase
MTKRFVGRVVKGDGVAGPIYGLATANLDLSLHPNLDVGIYAGHVTYEGKQHGAVVCYGNSERKKFEVHILDFNKQIVGETLEGVVLAQVSEYVDGYSTERLRQKMIHDTELVRAYLESLT